MLHCSYYNIYLYDDIMYVPYTYLPYNLPTFSKTRFSNKISILLLISFHSNSFQFMLFIQAHNSKVRLTSFPQCKTNLSSTLIPILVHIFEFSTIFSFKIQFQSEHRILENWTSFSSISSFPWFLSTIGFWCSMLSMRMATNFHRFTHFI